MKNGKIGRKCRNGGENGENLEWEQKIEKLSKKLMKKSKKKWVKNRPHPC